MSTKSHWVLLAWLGSLAGCQTLGANPEAVRGFGPALGAQRAPRVAATLATQPPLAGGAARGVTAGSPGRASHDPEAGALACLGADAGPLPVSLPERVSFGDFWTALGAQLDALDTTALTPRFEAFLAQHQLRSTPELRRDFTRLWAVFEATRDGGWWRLRWQITDQEPSSSQIWKAWRKSPPEPGFATPSAVAECDEITALLSVTARRLGVRGVGLFYPTWNHVIAGWSPASVARSRPDFVALIPTTQIFQGCAATFDQTSFKPPRQVYEFPRRDVRDDSELPLALASFLLEQVRAYGEASPALLALIRTKRAELLQSSVGDCGAFRRALVSQVQGSLSCADHRALRHLATAELQRPELSDAELWAFLGGS